MRIREIISKNNLFVPGFDITKTGIFILLNILLLFLVTDNPILNISDIEIQNTGLIITDIKNISKLSLLLILLNLILIVLSGASAFKVLELDVQDLHSYNCLFYAKILLNITILIFFLIISLWVILLGGVKNSPYAALLSMSPILLSIQIFRDKKIDEDKILNILSQNSKKALSLKDKKKWDRTKRFSRMSGFIPLILIVLTLIFGYFEFNVLKIKIIEISNTVWFSRLYYIIYYSSVFIALFGVLPREWTNSITKRLF